MPNIQFHEINVDHTLSFLISPTPSKKAKSWGKNIFLTNNYAIYWEHKKTASSFWFKMPNIGAKVAAELFFEVGLQSRP